MELGKAKALTERLKALLVPVCRYILRAKHRTSGVKYTARSDCKWTPEELQYLSDHYGLISDKTLAHNLNRSVNGIVAAAIKNLHGRRRKDNFYSAEELARVLGLTGGRKPVYWAQRGWLKCRRGPMKVGLNRIWCFREKNVVKCLRQRPWLVDLKSMEEHYFRSVVQKEWERDPWYTCGQACFLLGVKADMTIERYIRRGWLPADKKPHGGSRGGAWIIRHSAIEAFLADDPRPQGRYRSLSESRRHFLFENGQPSRLAIVWVIKCPSCKQQVRVTASPQLRRGRAVRDMFVRLYVNGNCQHGTDCLISMNGNGLTPEALDSSLKRHTE